MSKHGPRYRAVDLPAGTTVATGVNRCAVVMIQSCHGSNGYVNPEKSDVGHTMPSCGNKITRECTRVTRTHESSDISFDDRPPDLR